MRVDYRVAYLSDFIDEHHHFSFEDLCRICEVSDIAKTINSHYFLTRDDNINELWILNDFWDDLRSSLTKTYGQKSSYLDN